jgi:hypothetical protein
MRAVFVDAGLASPADTGLLQKIATDFRAAGQAADEEFHREKMHELMYVAAEAMERASDTGS